MWLRMTAAGLGPRCTILEHRSLGPFAFDVGRGDVHRAAKQHTFSSIDGCESLSGTSERGRPPRGLLG